MKTDHTVHLQRCLDRLRAGDESAREELLERARRRLAFLARKMFKHYPRLKRWEETDDVYQSALLRLCRALQQVTPATVRDFFRLAALQIRRELIDLTRHYFGRYGPAANHVSPNRQQASGSQPPPYEQADSSQDPSRLALLAEFHNQVDALPASEREMVDMLYYQGLTRAEAASLLGINERTLRRHWQSVRLKLYNVLKGDMPEL